MSDNITNDENVLECRPDGEEEAEAADEKNSDNSLAIIEDDDDKDDVREVTAKRLKTGAFKSWRKILKLLLDDVSVVLSSYMFR